MAGRIPQSFIDELLARVDIVEVIDRHVPLRHGGRDHKGLCPFHDEKSPSFTVSQDKQFYHCFGCGAHGSAINFLMQFSSLGFVEAVEELAQVAGMQIPREEGADAPVDPHRELFEINDAAARYFTGTLRTHAGAARVIDYLRQRGVSGEIARDFAIGYAPPEWDGLLGALGTDAARTDLLLQAGLIVRNDRDRSYDRFRDRVMFPIHDQRGRIVGFGGRIIDTGEPKYLNSPESPIFHKGQELYGLHRARKAIRDQQCVLVVEGYMDVVALAQHGVAHAVAALGTATTRDHLERLFRLTPEIVFCFDGDAAGERAAQRALVTALPLLAERHYVSFLFLPAGEDPDSQVRKHGNAMFLDRSAVVPLSDFLFRQLTAEIDLRSIDGQARLVDKARPLLEKIPRGVYRSLLEQRLAELAHLPASHVATAVAGTDRPPGPPPPAPRIAPRTRKEPSLVRTAITRLLQYPGLALSAEDLDGVLLRNSETPGAALLAELIELVRQRPELKAGAILERYRDSSVGGHLANLLADTADLGPAASALEFRAALLTLRDRAAASGAAEMPDGLPSQLTPEQKAAVRQQVADLAKRR